MKQKTLLFILFLLSTLMASAQTLIDGIYYNLITEAKQAKVTSGDTKYTGSVTIPESFTYNGVTYSVTSIGGSAFSYCTGLTSVTIPNSVTSIASGAFWNCSGLTSVTIPNSVTSIESSALFGCSGLTSITIPNSVTSIGKRAFSGCSGLTSVTIPNSVTSIGDYAFYECSGLTSISVESGNKKYDSRNNCNAIIETASNTLIVGCKNTTIPNSVTSIGSSAFSGCSGLTSVTIPNSVKSIGSYAFSYCTGLTSVTIPNSVKSIGSSAFNGVDLPTVISLIENPSAIQGKTDDYYRTFSLNTFNNATLYVPVGTIEKYKATTGWKDFVFIEEGAGGGDTPETQKCATPTISYVDGKLTFSCETEDAELHYEYSYPQGGKGVGSEVSVNKIILVTVYATKDGYENSDVATKEIEIGGSTAEKGDVNEDGQVNGTDIQEVINIIVNAE